MLTVSHTKIINIIINGKYFLNVWCTFPDLKTCQALVNISGNINNAIAVLGAMVMVIRPIAVVGNPNPATPFIVPAIIKIENKHKIKNTCSVIISFSLVQAPLY